MSARREALASTVRGLDDRIVSEYLRGMDVGRQQAIAEALAHLGPELRARIQLSPDPRADLARAAIELEDEKTRLGLKIKDLNRMIAAGDEFIAWIDRPPHLEAVSESILHRLNKTTIISPRMEVGEASIEPEEFAVGCEVFLVQHDWAALLNGARVDEGAVRLPYERCCFEFSISDKRVCALISSPDGEPSEMLLFVRLRDGWMYADAYVPLGNSWERRAGKDGKSVEPFVLLVGAQVRAIAITLDAEVTVTEVVRAPHLANAKRIRRNETPVFDHHVISLARRPRALSLPRHGEPAYHVRLHFRRGHWRHYERHKTWIKWMLVGDPSLGFAAKDYAL